MCLIYCLWENSNSVYYLERRDVSRSVLFVHSLSSYTFTNHVSEDTQHSSTAIVKFNIKFACLLLRVFDISTEVSNTVVSIIFGSRHPSKFYKSEESKDLCDTSSWDGEESSESSWNIGEFKVSGRGKESIENNVVVVYNVSYNSSHSNTSVFTFNSTTTFESLWLSFQPSKRIENSEWFGNTKLKLAYLQSSRCSGGACRGESSSRREKECSNSELHFDIFVFDAFNSKSEKPM